MENIDKRNREKENTFKGGHFVVNEPGKFMHIVN